jgi:hypothetical protein
MRRPAPPFMKIAASRHSTRAFSNEPAWAMSWAIDSTTALSVLATSCDIRDTGGGLSYNFLFSTQLQQNDVQNSASHRPIR